MADISSAQVRSQIRRDDSPHVQQSAIEVSANNESSAPVTMWVKSKKSQTLRPLNESGLLPLPRLPSDWSDPGRSHWVFGWALHASRYAEALWRGWGIKGGPSVWTTASVHTKLKRDTGYEHFVVICGKPDAQAEADDIVMHVPDDYTVPNSPRTATVHILGIVSTGSARLYTRRPNQEQYDMMVDLLGEPRWIECVEPKKGFKLSWLD
ncbi:hypothetical protein BKA70DRAFT_1443483 [Coprinopsis sp. MPI-PUGE-AT-0042]|nr:hypothetical protein BKA70DRAFT_1443483 [Coprinopsis sp. MPI-PUGE-AT-0042]